MTTLVSFTLDNLGDAADLHRGVINSPRKPGTNPAFEKGYPALMELSAEFGVPLTYFIEGWSAQQYPEELQKIQAQGHEIGMHGWQHESWTELNEYQIRELCLRSTESIKKAIGKAPVAFRAPGGISTPYTRKILADLGYTIDASHTGDGWIRTETSRLVCIPYTWEGVDASHWLWENRSCEEVEDIWFQALEKAAEEGRHFVFIWHPHVMGMNPDRLETGRRIIRFVHASSRYSVVRLSSIRNRALTFS
jgi:peptidoglycan/xylan/chitin deacetylase (PgdA/CDA1 family)